MPEFLRHEEILMKHYTMRFRLSLLSCVFCFFLDLTGFSVLVAQSPAPSAVSAAQPPPKGLTTVDGIKVGHYTLQERLTGCTVVLVENGAVAGVDVRGSAPGTRETDLLHPLNTVEQVQAIVLAGGSAFGLDAATGVVDYLEERGLGFDTGVAKVPIVPAAILFDLGVGDAQIRPTAECGYQAAVAAASGPVPEGNVGAGAGATVGKLQGPEQAMKAGIGTAAFTLPNGLTVAALVAVNALGDIIDPSTGQIIAGIRTANGKGLANVRKLLQTGALSRAQAGKSTTLGVVATNARLTKVEVTKIAQMAHDGLARAISPVHTPFDGDTIFVLATGRHQADAMLLTIGSLAADAVAEAVVRAARTARSIPGYPAARDLGTVDNK